MERYAATRPPARRRKAMLWSLLPLLAAAIGLSTPTGARAQNDAGLSAPDSAAPGTTGLGTDTGEARDASRGNAAAQPNSSAVRISKMIGMAVRNPRGEDVGEIQDLVVDVNNQRVHYAVLSFGGFLGVGDKLFAYPARLFRHDAERNHLVLDVNREQLRQWPGFERGRWSDLQNESYRQEVERFHGKAPANSVAAEMRPNMRLMRASALLGKDINDLQGNDAGKVEDLVVDLRDGRVRYMVMEFDRRWNPIDKLVALPMNAFDFPAREDIDLRLGIDRERLKTARSFDAKRWPELNVLDGQRNMEGSIGSMGTRENTEDAARER